jgi:hypothetical protein
MISSLSFPATTNRDFVHKEFIRHIEHLCARLRKHALAACVLTIHIKNSKQEVTSYSCTLPQHSNTPGIFIDHFEILYPNILQNVDRIRTTGAAVSDIIPESAANISLFDKRDAREDIIFKTIDGLGKRGLSVRSGIGI